MAQDLYYISSSLSLTLINDNGQTNYWNNITSLEISGSGYDAPISGSEFIGTVGTARIYAYSGSIEVVSFPLEDTNLFYPPFPHPLSLESFFSGSQDPNTYSGFYWSFNFDSTGMTGGEMSGSGFSVYDLTDSSSYITVSLDSNSGGSGLIAGNNYLFVVSGSGSYDAYLTINNVTSGSIIFNGSSSNTPISTSIIPIEFNNYEVAFSVISTYAP